MQKGKWKRFPFFYTVISTVAEKSLNTGQRFLHSVALQSK